MSNAATPSFTLEITDRQIVVLSFDSPHHSANLLNESVLLELDTRIGEVESSRGLTGLIVRSAKPAMFCAGADIKELGDLRGSALEDLITLGQNVFGRLASLPIPTVAAIHGPCAGGGCELALACDWRLASDSPKTRVGLPETQLGILPAWGGTTRLPRLVGLPSALRVILSGKMLKANSARRAGLIDEVVPAEYLLSKAEEFLERGKRSRKPRRILHSFPSVSFIKLRTRMGLRARTRGHYPAPFKALEVASRSVSTTEFLSLRNEREAILDLSQRSETRNLKRLFFLRERARKIGVPNGEAKEIQQVAVIGAGVMGAGIAYWLSARGIPVTLQDISPDALAKGMARIDRLYQNAARRRILTKVEAARGLDRIVPVADRIPLRRMDLVIEAATENLELKQHIFSDLSRRCGPHTILATNTSALPIHELASRIPLPERLVGLHFFNPVHRMNLVEVVRTDTTSPDTLASAVRFTQQLGKIPVVVADRPGFLVNRILVPYLLRAGTLFAQGGDPVAIDRSMLDFGMPMGPLRLLDEVGLDVAQHVAATLSRFSPDRFPAVPLLKQMIREGLLGRKTGAGFYLYGEKGPRPNPAALALRDAVIPLPDDLGTRLAMIMVAEAKRCLDEGVAASADEIDLAMILGTGFPPFRGGPLSYGRETGLLKPRDSAESRPADFRNLHSTPATL